MSEKFKAAFRHYGQEVIPDGRIVSPPLEDLAPFLPREEIAKNMFIPLVDEEK